MNTPTQAQLDAGRFIFRKEARLRNGRLAVFLLHPEDGGGKYEIAGINDRYHPQKAAQLKRLVESGRHEDAEREAVLYYIKYTDTVKTWHKDHHVRAFLRDCALNRGAGGAAWMLLRACKTARTYKGRIRRSPAEVGPNAKRAANRHEANDLVLRLLLTRQRYEVIYAKRDEKSRFWDGLNNRWVDAAQFALDIGDPFAHLK